MDGRLPLPTLLSHALVAFAIEFDNEAEHRIPHRTTDHGITAGALYAPWLVSMAMWFNCMRFVTAEGVTVLHLEHLARTKTNLPGMDRWGYVTVQPDPSDSRLKPPRSAWLVRSTAAGRMVQQVWQPLFAVIEQRWEDRFGGIEIHSLREALQAIVVHLDPGLPDCLPILGYGLRSRPPDPDLPPPETASNPDLPLPALLARVLLAFALEFERESHLSLAICANILRVLNEKGVRVRDLPILTGVSKPSISMAMGILRKFRLAVVEKSSDGGPWQVAHLTPKGCEVQETYRRFLQSIESRWQSHFGNEAIRRLREPLELLVGSGEPGSCPLFECLVPYSDGWRALVRKPAALPHYPMVLHRGGYPDGS